MLQDLQGLQDRLDLQGLQDLRVQQGRPDHKERLPDLERLLLQPDRLVLQQAGRIRQRYLLFLFLKVLQEIQALQDRPAQPVRMVRQDQQDQRVQQERRRVSEHPPFLPVLLLLLQAVRIPPKYSLLQFHRAQQGLQVLPALQVQQALRAQQAQQDLQGRMVRMVQQALRVQQQGLEHLLHPQAQ